MALSDSFGTPFSELGNAYHEPVLCHEAIAYLITNPHGTYIDATLGGGGHSRAILDSLSADGTLIGFDRDQDATSNAPRDERFHFVAGNFRHIAEWLDYAEIRHVDGILADLGVSSHHFDEAKRGFSFRFEEAELDMRMNRRATRSAKELLAELSPERLSEIFHKYGELSDANRLAQLLVKARTQQPIRTMQELQDVLRPALSPDPVQRRKKLTKLCQALRIEVNDEMRALEQLLLTSEERLKPGGRLVILSYHSLEDRMVKEFLRTAGLGKQDDSHTAIYGGGTPTFKTLGGKPTIPTEEEVARNPRARSAKMRVGEKR